MGDAGVVADLLLADKLRVFWPGAGIEHHAPLFQHGGVVPVALYRRPQVLVLIQVEVILGCVIGGVGPHEASHQEEGLAGVPAAQKVDAPAGHPVGGVVFFCIGPGAGGPAVAVHAGVGHVRIRAQLAFQPVEIIVRDQLVFAVFHIGVTIFMQVAVVQLHVVEAQIVAQGMHMHLAHALGVVAGPAQFSGHGAAVVPVHPILIAHLSGVALAQARVQNGPGGHAGGAGGPGIGKIDAVGGKGVQIRSFHIRVPGIAQAVSPLLIGHDQKNVGAVRHSVHNLSENRRQGVFPPPRQ